MIPSHTRNTPWEFWNNADESIWQSIATCKQWELTSCIIQCWCSDEDTRQGNNSWQLVTRQWSKPVQLATECPQPKCRRIPSSSAEGTWQLRHALASQATQPSWGHAECKDTAQCDTTGLKLCLTSEAASNCHVTHAPLEGQSKNNTCINNASMLQTSNLKEPCMHSMMMHVIRALLNLCKHCYYLDQRATAAAGHYATKQARRKWLIQWATTTAVRAAVAAGKAKSSEQPSHKQHSLLILAAKII